MGVGGKPLMANRAPPQLVDEDIVQIEAFSKDFLSHAREHGDMSISFQVLRKC